jgi:hypothetical protein
VGKVSTRHSYIVDKIIMELLKNLYGIRDVGQGFELFVAEVMVELLGFTQGTFNPCLFHHVDKGIRVFVHGDDFAAVGKRSHLEWFALELGKHMMVKDKGTLGPNQSSASVTSPPTGGKGADHHEIRLLNRTIRWIPSGADSGGERLEWEADLRHAQLMGTALGLAAASKAVTTPGVKEKVSPIDGDELSSEEASVYKSVCMRGMFMAQDRPDFQYASKETSRSMARPTVQSMAALKRIGRYLKNTPRVAWVFKSQSYASYLDVYCDS